MIEEVTIHTAATALRSYGLRYSVRGCDTWDDDSDGTDAKVQPDSRSDLARHVATLCKPTSLRRRHEIEQLAPMLRCSHILRAIPDTARRSLCRAASHRHAVRGECVYRPGDDSDAFFLVLRGTVSIEAPREIGSESTTILAKKTARHGFGDLALIEDIPRSNTAVVESDEVDLMVLRKEDYQLTMHAFRAEEILNTLAIPTADRTQGDRQKLKQFIADKISFFTDNHSEEELLSMCGFMEAEHFGEAGSYVFRQGDSGDGMYIVFSAEVEIVLEGLSGRPSNNPLALKTRAMMRARRKSMGSIALDGLNISELRVPSIEEGRATNLFSRCASDTTDLHDLSSSLPLPQRSGSVWSARSFSPGRSPDSASSRRTPSSPNESPRQTDWVVARYSHGEIFGEPSLWQRDSRAASARIASPGYLIKLSKIDFRRVVQEVFDKNNEVLHFALRKAFKIGDDVSHEFMLKVANIFTERTFRAGQTIALQGAPIEDVFVIKAGSCAVSLDLKMVRRVPGDTAPTTQNLKLNAATVGANENIGFVDYWTNKECWLTSYVASTELTVLKGSTVKVLNLLERHAKHLAAFKYLEALKARGRAQRLKAKLHILSGRGLVPSKRDNAELSVFEELVEAPGEEHKWEVESEASDDDDDDHEFLSKEKQALLSDVKFAGAHLHAVREAKSVRTVVLPKLNLAGVVATRERLLTLSTATTQRFRQEPASPKEDQDLYLGMQKVSRGCWLSLKVPRSSFKSSTGALTQQGKYANEAMKKVQRQKDLELARKTSYECTGTAASVFDALDQSSTRAQLSSEIVRGMRRQQVLAEVLPRSRYGGLAFLPRAGRRPRSRNFMLASTVDAQRNPGPRGPAG